MFERPYAAAFIATSLDGFIARADGALDWLPTPGAEDYGYKAFMEQVDAVVLGRATFEVVRSFGGAWPYAGKRTVVLSSGAVDVAGTPLGADDVLNLAPEALLHHLGTRGARRLYVDGGQTIQRFVRAGVLDEVTLTHIPVLLGSGVPLFGPLAGDVRLEHLGTAAYPDGLVQSRYRVGR